MSPALPLAGIRVLTFESFGAGPFGSMYLADLGAEVIKIENPEGGDASRAMGPFFLGANDSHYFQTFNLNKKSCALNLKHPLGDRTFRRLVATADVVMNNLRGDQPEKLGLTYEALKSANPRIVCAHLSAYGRDNERMGWPGYDYLMQAEAGYMHLTGEPGTPPTRMGLSIIDFMTGITMALALVSALLSLRRRGGAGLDIDVSLFDVALHQLSYPATWFLNEGQGTERQPRSAHPSATPVQVYRTKDGCIFLMCMTEKFWQQLVLAMGTPPFTQDPRFATLPERRRHRDELTALLDERLSEHTTDHWLGKFQGLVPAAPVNDVPNALNNPFVRRVEMVRATPHPSKPGFMTLANPIKLDGQRLPARVCSPVGADTDSVLRELGLSEPELGALRAAGAV